MAGFQVTFNGRFCVTAEEHKEHICLLRASNAMP